MESSSENLQKVDESIEKDPAGGYSSNYWMKLETEMWNLNGGDVIAESMGQVT